MASAYTPGLKVAEKSVVLKERKLPLFGEVLVKKGDKVKARQLVAKTELPGKIFPISVAGELGLSKPEELHACMLKKEGEAVKEGELIAQTKGFFGLFKSEYRSKITGTITEISKRTGQVIFSEPPIPVEVDAYIDGEVVDVIEKEGVVVKTEGVHIQGILGLGGETYGSIAKCAKTKDELIDENSITEDYKGKIIICGSRITAKALEKAKKIGVIGVVVGGFDYEDVKSILGKDLGVAITGHEDIGLTLIITEGFGTIPMADRTFDLLTKYEGMDASINGATQIRAGVMRPEIIITHTRTIEEKAKNYAEAGIEKGDQIRVIRTPYFGKLGIVKELPVELCQVESGTWVRTLKAEIDGEIVVIPRANIEVIEK